jgi:hypothetical protein
MEFYILEGKKPKQVESLIEWAEWSSKNNRQVKRTELPDGVIVSTIFIGQDTRISKAFPPILFETMIRGGKHDMYIEKYSTWEEAEKGHEKAIRIVFDVEEDQQIDHSHD